MLRAKTARRGIVTAPHHLAARAGLRVMEEGGNAIEAMIAADCKRSALPSHLLL